MLSNEGNTDYHTNPNYADQIEEQTSSYSCKALSPSMFLFLLGGIAFFPRGSNFFDLPCNVLCELVVPTTLNIGVEDDDDKYLNK